MSHYAEMRTLAGTAREQLSVLEDTLRRLDDLCCQVQNWYDSMDEGWQRGDKGEQASRIGGLYFDSFTALSEVTSALDELEGAL